MRNRAPITWSFPVGRYAFEVGAYTGSFAQFAPASSKTDEAQARRNAAALRKALAQEDDQQQRDTPLEAVEKLEDSADAVTDRVEHANRLFEALAEDRLLDPRLLTAEVGALLGLLDRLDREGRYEEEIRVAKALHGLCVLAFRWLDLVRALRRALAAAKAVGDEAGQAWALNELGALHLCAGEARTASEHLESALELYEKLGDAAGRCSTRHNFDSARRDVTRPIQIRAPSRLLTAGGSVRPLVAGVVGVAVLVVLGFLFAPMPAKGTGDLAVTIGERPLNPSASAVASFSFSADGAGGFECKLDDGAFKTCTTPVRYKRLGEGEHTFRVRATATGERGPATAHVWRIDLTAPTTTITEGPSGRTPETSAAFSFTANEEVGGFECKLDDGSFAGCTSPYKLPGPLEDGKYAFAVRAIDVAGNVGNPDRYQWRISSDRTTLVPPVVGLRIARGIEALAGVRLKWEVQEAASTDPVGQIVDQVPAAGKEVRVGTTVTVMVSAGIEIGVPSVLRLTESGAVKELEQAGLRASIVRATSSAVPAGLVFDQNPDPGTEVGAGALVEIEVSLGSELSDLTVSIPADGVDVSCPNGVGSCVTTVTFTVTNQGKGDLSERFDVLVAADPGERRTVTLRGGIAAGASVARTTQLGPGGNCYDPDCFVSVEADPDGRVLESNERNNVASWARIG
jgi:tetratricopeptide (TPR) repeat protein